VVRTGTDAAEHLLAVSVHRVSAATLEVAGSVRFVERHHSEEVVERTLPLERLLAAFAAAFAFAAFAFRTEPARGKVAVSPLVVAIEQVAVLLLSIHICDALQVIPVELVIVHRRTAACFMP
jgi:hypothetical protein